MEISDCEDVQYWLRDACFMQANLNRLRYFEKSEGYQLSIPQIEEIIVYLEEALERYTEDDPLNYYVLDEIAISKLRNERNLFRTLLEIEKEKATITNTHSEPMQEQVSNDFSNMESEGTPFTEIKRKRTRPEEPFSPQKSKIANTIPIKLNNKFAVLDEVNEPPPPPSPKIIKTTNRVQPPKNIRPITCNLKGLNINETLRTIASTSQSQFSVTPSGDFFKLFPTTPPDFEKIAKALDTLKIPHFLIKTKSTYPLKIVIRGLPIDMPLEDIESELKAKNYPVLKVNQMTNFKNKKLMPLFQIHLEDSPNSREIFKLESLLYFIIKIENYNRPSRTMQCYKCQHFHHTAQECKLTPRCVKCAGLHETANCEHGKGRIPIVKCCNCSGDHPANFRGCPKFPENKNKINNNQTRSNFSFADAVKNNSSSSHPDPTHQSRNIECNPQFEDFSKLANIISNIQKELNFPSFNSLIDKYSKILEELKNTTDPKIKEAIFFRSFFLN